MDRYKFQLISLMIFPSVTQSWYPDAFIDSDSLIRLQYAIFGKVTKGYDTLARLEELPTKKEGIFVMVRMS